MHAAMTTHSTLRVRMPIAAMKDVPEIKAHAAVSPERGIKKACFPDQAATAMHAVTENSRLKLN